MESLNRARDDKVGSELGGVVLEWDCDLAVASVLVKQEKCLKTKLVLSLGDIFYLIFN